MLSVARPVSNREEMNMRMGMRVGKLPGQGGEVPHRGTTRPASAGRAMTEGAAFGPRCSAWVSFQLEADGTVVAPHHLGRDPGALERRAQFFRGHEVIDAPPDVPCAAVHH